MVELVELKKKVSLFFKDFLRRSKEFFKMVLTPVEQLNKDYPLIAGCIDIAKMSKKWNKRWQHLANPWPENGTFDDNVIKVLEVLIESYKAGVCKGARGQKRAEKRNKELQVLQLFSKAGKRNRSRSLSPGAILVTKKSCLDEPFSHTAPIPPPYDVKSRKDLYPVLPVMRATGKYELTDDSDQIIQTGQASARFETTPDSGTKAATTSTPLDVLKQFGKREKASRNVVGGYDPKIRDQIERAEREGHTHKFSISSKVKVHKPPLVCCDDSDSDVSGEVGLDDSDKPPSLDRSYSNPNKDIEKITNKLQRVVAAREDAELALEDAETRGDKERQQILQSELATFAQQEEVLLSDRTQLEKELELRKGHYLRLPKPATPSKTLPVRVQGTDFIYKPMPQADIDIILKKSPLIEEGALAFLSRIDEAFVGDQPSVGDVKRLLVKVLGQSRLAEAYQRAGIGRHATTSVHDPELFVTYRGRLWNALQEMFPTNIHPNDIILPSLKDDENPRNYVSTCYQKWGQITGRNAEGNKMELAFLREKIMKGLPVWVRNRLDDVVGLSSFSRQTFTDHVSHHVECFRKKERALKAQDEEAMRKLTQIQLMESFKNNKDKNQAVVLPGQQQPVMPFQGYYPTVVAQQSHPFDSGGSWGGPWGRNEEEEYRFGAPYMHNRVDYVL